MRSRDNAAREDVAQRVARMSHREWKQSSCQRCFLVAAKSCSRPNFTSAKGKATSPTTAQSAFGVGQYGIELAQAAPAAAQGGAAARQEKIECCKMAGEETRAAIVERKIATEVGDHAGRGQNDVRTRLVAETVCKNAIKYMEKLRPFKTKYTQLLRRTGLHSMSKSLSQLLEACPKEVLGVQCAQRSSSTWEHCTASNWATANGQCDEEEEVAKRCEPESGRHHSESARKSAETTKSITQIHRLTEAPAATAAAAAAATAVIKESYSAHEKSGYIAAVQFPAG